MENSMYLSSRHELFVLLGTFVGGVVLGLVFDVFRIYRKNFKTHIVWIQDVLMWAVILAVVYTTVYITNSGQLRLYEFVGFAAGAVVYMVVFSRCIIAVFSAIISVLKKVFFAFCAVVIFPVRLIMKLLSPPLIWIKKLVFKLFCSQKLNFLRFSRIFKKI